MTEITFIQKISTLSRIIGNNVKRETIIKLLRENDLDVAKAADSYFQSIGSPKSELPPIPCNEERQEELEIDEPPSPITPSCAEEKKVEYVNVEGDEEEERGNEELKERLESEIEENFAGFCRSHNVPPYLQDILRNNGISDLAKLANLTRDEIAKMRYQHSPIKMGTQNQIVSLVRRANEDTISLQPFQIKAPQVKDNRPVFAYDTNFLYLLQEVLKEGDGFNQFFLTTKGKIDNFIPYYVIMEIDNQSKRKGDGRIGELALLAKRLLQKLLDLKECISVENNDVLFKSLSMPHVGIDDIIIKSVQDYVNGRKVFLCSADKAMGIKSFGLSNFTIVRTVENLFDILTNQVGIPSLPEIIETVPNQHQQYKQQSEPSQKKGLKKAATNHIPSILKQFTVIVKGIPEKNKNELIDKVAKILEHRNFFVSYINEDVAKIFLKSELEYLGLLALRGTKRPLSFHRWNREYYIHEIDGVDQKELKQALTKISPFTIEMYQHLNVAVVRFTFGKERVIVPSIITVGLKKMFLVKKFDRMVSIKTDNMEEAIKLVKSIEPKPTYIYAVRTPVLQVWCEDLQFLDKLVALLQQHQDRKQVAPLQQHQDPKQIAIVSPTILYAHFFNIGPQKNITSEEATNMFQMFMGDFLQAFFQSNILKVTIDGQVRSGYFAYLWDKIVMIVCPNLNPKVFLFSTSLLTPDIKKAVKEHELVQQHGVGCVQMFRELKLIVFELANIEGAEKFEQLDQFSVKGISFTKFVFK